MKKLILVLSLFLFVSLFAFASDDYVVVSMASRLVHQFSFSQADLSLEPIRAVMTTDSEYNAIAVLINYMSGKGYEYVESLGKQLVGKIWVWSFVFKKK